MPKTKRPVRAEFMGAVWEAATKAEAEAGARKKIEELAHDVQTYPPALLRWRGFIAIVWRDAECWTYVIEKPDGKGTNLRPMVYQSGGTGEHGRELLICNAATHLFDYTADWSKGDLVGDARDAIELFESNWIQALKTQRFASLLRNLVERCAWQRAYRRHRDAGHTDQESHHFACEHDSSAEVTAAIDLAMAPPNGLPATLLVVEPMAA